MSKSMLGGRGGSTITDAAVFRINKVKTTVLEFLGNVDIQAQKIIIDINVESNNLIIGDISDELIYIEQQLETIQNDISNTELNIENINENLFDISNTLFINIKNELSEISNISTSIHDNTSNITIKLGNNGNTMEYYTNEILDDLSSNIDSSSNHDIVNSVKSIYSILVDLCNNSTYTYDTYDTNKLYSLKVDVSNLNYNINDISQQYFFRDYSEKIESIYHNFKNIDKIINYNYSIENDILDILAHLNFPNSSNSQNIPNNQVKSLYDLLYYFKINSTYNLDESNNVKVLNINMNSLNYEISNDETLEYFFNDYIQKIDDIYNKINDISNNYIEKTINDIDNKLSNILSDLSSSNTTLSTYDSNNQVKSLYHLFADLCDNIIDISYDTQTNNLLEISIDISNISYDICGNELYFFDDYMKKIEDICNNLNDIYIETNEYKIKVATDSLYSSNETNSTYNPNNQVKSLYHLFADLCNNIIDISYDTQTNNLLDISINISHFSYDICDNNIYFFHDYIKKVEDISNNISDICGNIKTNIVIQNSSGIYDDISNIKNLVSNSNVLTFVDNIEKSIVKIDYYNGNIIDFSNKINEKINIDNHIQNNFNSITNIDSSINSIYTNTLNIVNDICYALYQLNTIDISLLNLDSTLDNIDSSNELILQNNVEIKSAATTINTQYTVARSSINAIDPLNI
jgi:hypothetical protein